MTHKSVSWWVSLHDGYLERFITSAHDRTVTLAVRIDHLTDDGQNGRSANFEIKLKTVRAVHVTAWESWGPPDPQDQAAWNKALVQGRVVSIEVEDFADSGLRIADATVYETLAKELIWPLATFVGPETPLRLLTLDVDGSESEGFGDRGIAVIFDEAQISREGRPLTEEAFLAFGESYWRTFRKTQPNV